MKLDYEKLKKEDLTEEIKDISISKDAFGGPLKCTICHKNMIKTKSSMDLSDIDITIHFEVWRCNKCNREYLDGKQAKRLDKILEFENILKDKTLKFERVLNFDGRTFFMRFPAEITKGWNKNLKTEIKALSATDFFVHIHK